MCLALVFRDSFHPDITGEIGEAGENLETNVSVDATIMDHINQGLPYFIRCLGKIQTLKGDKTPHLSYLQTYMKVYFEIYNLYLDYHPNTIIEFVKKIHALQLKDSDFYYQKIYTYCQQLLPSIHKNINIYDQIHFIGELLKIDAFREKFIPLEIEKIPDTKYIEETTILGWLIYNVSDQEISKYFVETFQTILTKDDGGLTLLASKYMTKIYQLNRHRLYTDQFTRKPCNSEMFLHGICLILFTLKENLSFEHPTIELKRDRKQLDTHMTNMMEVTFNPLLTNYHSLKNQTMDFENIPSSNPMYTYLSRIQQRVQKKVMKYETMFDTIFKPSFDKVTDVYCDIADNIIQEVSDDYSLTGHQEILVQTIFNFVILVEPVYTFRQENLPVFKLFELASHIITEKIKITNQSIKLLAFEVIQTLESIHRDKILVSSLLVESIIKLYNRVPNDDSEFTTTNYRRLIVLFLNRKKEWINSLEYIDQATLRKFICLLIGETNNLVESIYTKYQKKVSLNKLTIMILKGCKHVHFLEQLANRYLYLFKDASIYTSFVNFVGYQIHLISTGLQKISMCMPILRSISRILIDFSSQEDFISKLMEHTQIEKYPETIQNILSTGIVALDPEKKISNEETLASKLIRLENGREKTLTALLEAINKKLEKNEISDSDTEIPLEFCDPLLCTPIEDPVVIPNTDIIMDRAIITRRLLEEEENPFTRSSLTIEELNDYNKTEPAKKLVATFKDKLDLFTKEKASQAQLAGKKEPTES